MADLEADLVTPRDATSLTRLMGHEGENPGNDPSKFGKYPLDSINYSTYIGWFEPAVDGTTDDSQAFVDAVASLSATGGLITLPAGHIRAQDIPLDTGAPDYHPITYIGNGAGVTKVQLKSTPTGPLFKSAQPGDFRGGGVLACEIVGDAQGGTGQATDPISLKSGTQDGIDLSSTNDLFEFLVDGCFVHNFRFGWVGGTSSRSPVFGTNNWRYNEIAIYNKNEHPLFSGVNDIRANYIGLGGEIWFDCEIDNQKINGNHYGIMCDRVVGSPRIEKSTISNTFLFKNKKAGILINGDIVNFKDSPGMVAPDALDIITLTFATTILTITTGVNHSLEVGDRIWLWDVGGLTPDPNELVGASELTVASIVDSDTFTVNVGSTVSGPWDTNGQLTAYVAHVEMTNNSIKVKGNIIRDSADAGRCGVADVYANGTTLVDIGVDGNETYGSTTAAPNLKRIFFASNCSTELRVASLQGNQLSEYDQAVRRIDGRIDQSNVSGNVCRLGTNGPGSGNDYFELDDSSFGNVIRGNIVSEIGTSSTVAGDNVFNVDAVRSVFDGNHISYDESQWSAGLNVTAVDGDTVPNTLTAGTSTGSTDTANAKTNNVITSF